MAVALAQSLPAGGLPAHDGIGSGGGGGGGATAHIENVPVPPA